MLEYALSYLKRGWAVIPCDGKDAMVKWKEYQTRLPTEEEVRRWWTQFPNANIGLVTGEVSGVAVVDIDPRHGGEPRAQFNHAPTGMVADTGGGGNHLFYEFPRGTLLGNKVGATPGVDIRANGGIIILPPSVHPETRRVYKWRTDGELGKWFGVPEAPKDSPAEAPQQSQKWLSELLQGVKEGGRNDAATKLAGYFEGKQIPKDVARNMMLLWDQKNNPRMGEFELDKTLDSVYSAASRKKGGMAAGSAFATTPFSDFMKRWARKEVHWVIDEWFPAETILLTVAPPGSFKSWLLMDLAVSLATGLPFLGQFEVKATGPVLIIQQEDWPGDVATRLAQIVYHKMGMEYREEGDDFSVPLPPDIPIHIHEERQLHFEDPNAMAAFASLVEEIKPILVVIDPLYSAASTDDYMAKATGSMMLLKSLRDKFGTSFAIAHHTKKKGIGSTGIDREDAWGSQFLNAFLESGWQIRRTEGEMDTIQVKRHYKVRGDLPELNVHFDIATEGEEIRYAVTVLNKEEGISGYPLAAKVLSAVEEGISSVPDIAQHTKESPSAVRNVLKKFIDDGVLIKRGSAYEIPEELPAL